ncbi:hypothetical protein N7470_004962 [Penicillium chermesinum]|nr:hypothetical protein N7470_004962 [Penicillium chermesinum]
MVDTYPIGTRSESENLVRDWGFRHVFTWSDGSLMANTAWMPGINLVVAMHITSPHTHRGLTTHLIRRGTLTITYPDDNAALHSGEVKKETFGAGARVDVPAGKLHEVWIGDEGCEYVIGE